MNKGYFFRTTKSGPSRKLYLLQSMFRLPDICSFHCNNSNNAMYQIISIVFHVNTLHTHALPKMMTAVPGLKYTEASISESQYSFLTLPSSTEPIQTRLANSCLGYFVCTPPTSHKTFFCANVSVAFTDLAKHFVTWLTCSYSEHPHYFQGPKRTMRK